MSRESRNRFAGAGSIALVVHVGLAALLCAIPFHEEELEPVALAAGSTSVSPIEVEVIRWRAPDRRTPVPDSTTPLPATPMHSSTRTAKLSFSAPAFPVPDSVPSRLPAKLLGPSVVPPVGAIELSRPDRILPSPPPPPRLPVAARIPIRRTTPLPRIGTVERQAVLATAAETLAPATAPRDAKTARATIRAQGRLRRELLARYPTSCKLRGHEGVTVVRMTVGRDGEARDVRVVRSAGCTKLDRALHDVLEDWTFDPAKRDGVAIDREYDLESEWTLE